ncbi:MAG: RNA 3'-terminal phosphate cyclase [Myxococcales bacterium]|nr:RNA 3'-terminal phosphate cyclase [Myxococcales bacterium]
MLTIDGAHGEGGGQIIRSALALALATGTPFAIERIRAGRAKPGLLRQHLTCVEAARAISGAEVTGARLGSGALTFAPGPLVAGDHRFDVGSAGSTLLVAQAIVPALLADGRAWSLELGGGTHNPAAPSFDFFSRALAPVLARMGAPVTATLDVAGFYPAGGGRVRLAGAAGARLGPLVLEDRGAIHGRQVIATVARVPASVAERELATVTERLGWDRATGVVAEVRSPGPGNVVAIVVEAAHVTEVFTAYGARGIAAETVAAAAARECAAYLATAAPVGEHLADQLLVPMALGGGGRFVTVAPTLHTRTQIDLIRQFLGVEVGAVDRGDGTWLVTVPTR